jgi:glutamine synthetase
MQIRLYRALPEHSGPAVQPPDSDESGNLTTTVVCLERDADPDANNHTGYDYWGAYGDDAEALDAWETTNADTLVSIDYTELPNPVTFYPSPFSGDTGATVLVRARDEDGRFISDDPATPDVNEAWTEVVL